MEHHIPKIKNILTAIKIKKDKDITWTNSKKSQQCYKTKFLNFKDSILCQRVKSQTVQSTGFSHLSSMVSWRLSCHAGRSGSTGSLERFLPTERERKSSRRFLHTEKMTLFSVWELGGHSSQAELSVSLSIMLMQGAESRVCL